MPRSSVFFLKSNPRCTGYPACHWEGRDQCRGQTHLPSSRCTEGQPSLAERFPLKTSGFQNYEVVSSQFAVTKHVTICPSYSRKPIDHLRSLTKFLFVCFSQETNSKEQVSQEVIKSPLLVLNVNTRTRQITLCLAMGCPSGGRVVRTRTEREQVWQAQAFLHTLRWAPRDGKHLNLDRWCGQFMGTIVTGCLKED